MHAQDIEVAERRSQVLTKAVAEAAARLSIGTKELGDIIGVSQSTASRALRETYQLKTTAKEWELAAHFVRLYRSLFAMVGGDEQLARAWLRSPNKAFASQAPIRQISRVDGLLRVCQYLDAHRSRV
jgi:uncharacterized protein (DUF2384 family)